MLDKLCCPIDFSLIHGGKKVLQKIMLYYSPFAYFPFFISHSNASFKLGPATNYADTAPEAFGRLCHATAVQG